MTDKSLSFETARIKREYLLRDTSEINKLYTYENPVFLYHMQERERILLKMINKAGIVIANSKVLEIGCGTGHILQRFLEFGAEKTFGIDLIENRIRNGKKNYPNVSLIQGNASQLPYTDNAFKLIMQFMCLSSVLDQSMRRSIAKEMWRVLEPGGVLISYDMRNPSSVLLLCFKCFKLFKFLIPRKWIRKSLCDRPKDSTPIKTLSIQEIRTLFPQGEVYYKSVSLEFNFAQIAKISFFAASLLSLVPWFRTHFLVIIRKPVFVHKT
jgi:ubiquinone/menaquinone biosynthesis C-methylase UbiE